MLPCNSFITRLLQLLGLLNSTSVACGNRSSCAVSAGSDMCCQLNSYRPSKKHGGVFFRRYFGSENNTWIWADSCFKFWLWFTQAPSGRRRRPSWTPSPAAQGKGSWVAGQPHQMQPLPSRDAQHVPECSLNPSRAWPTKYRRSSRLPSDTGSLWRMWVAQSTHSAAQAPAVTAVPRGADIQGLAPLLITFLGKDIYPWVALCQSGKRDFSSWALLCSILHSWLSASTSVLLSDALSCSPRSCGQWWYMKDCEWVRSQPWGDKIGFHLEKGA